MFFPTAFASFDAAQKRSNLLLICTAGIVSLFAAEYGHMMQWTSVFWLLPFRAWELLIGSFVAVAVFNNNRITGRATNILLCWASTHQFICTII